MDYLVGVDGVGVTVSIIDHNFEMSDVVVLSESTVAPLHRILGLFTLWGCGCGCDAGAGIVGS